MEVARILFWLRVRDAALLVLISLVAFIVFGELVIRLYLTRHTFYDVEMSRYASSIKADAENPLIGHVHRPNREVELMNASVRINSDGFRDDEYPIEKGDRWRIIFLGDSLTFGWGVEKEQSFEHLIEKALDAKKPTEIINFAAGNYNTVQEVNLFLEKGLEYRPDQVVLFYFINDAEPVPQRARFAWLGHFRIATFYWSRVKALLARLDPSTSFEDYYASLYKPGTQGWSDSRAALLELQEICRERGIVLQVVLLPELHRLVDYTFAREHALVSSFLRGNGIPVLDLAPSFANETDPTSLWVALDDAHPNAKAHRSIANYSADFIAAARGS
jgi:lysophospholipase L1-like esterase